MHHMVSVRKSYKRKEKNMNGADKKNVANGSEEEQVMENGLLLLKLTRTPRVPIFLQLDTTTHFRFTSPQLRFSFTLTRFAKWDSNAETFRARNFTFNFNQDDDDDDDDVEDDDEEGYFSANVKKKKKKKQRGWWSNYYEMRKKRSRNLFEEAIESIWILKAFKSYGWLLPTIIISLVAATGPKAFIMALAFSIGLSALSLAFEKLQEKTQRRPKRKKRMRRKTSYSNTTSVEEEQDEGQETGNKKMGEFWVGSDNGSVRKGSEEDESSFGGWDDLNGAGSMRRKSRVRDGSRRRRKEKLSGSGRNSEMPLLLRLLIAVFPFVSSWAEFW